MLIREEGEFDCSCGVGSLSLMHRTDCPAYRPFKPDLVNEPPHYRQGDIECIDAIAAALTREQFIGFLKGQVIKYVWRMDHKGSVKQDAEKAQWYLTKLLEQL